VNATEQHRRKRLFEELDAAYAKLLNDPEAWRLIEEERKAWDTTLGDGLPDGENWREDGAPRPCPGMNARARNDAG
jgi:hypothetical protein